MKIERYQTNRRGRQAKWLLPCGCLTLGVVGIFVTALVAMVVFPLLPDIILSNLGLEDVGNTTEILNQPVATVPSLMDVQTVGSVTLNSGSYSQTFGGTGIGYNVVIGDTEDTMQLQMQVSFTEDGLLQQCRELADICSSTGDGMRNASFDLRPNGMVINGEFQVPTGTWQDAGLVIQLSETNQLQIVGVDIGGRVFAPTNTDLASLVDEAEVRGNLFLQQISARAGINNFNLSTIIIDDTTMTFILR